MAFSKSFSVNYSFILKSFFNDSHLDKTVNSQDQATVLKVIWQVCSITVALIPKVGLKLNIQKMKIMASGPITPWEIDGETVERVSDFILGAPKSLQMVIVAMKLKDAYSLEEKL